MMRLTAALAVLLASMAPCVVEGFAAPASAAALRHNGFMSSVAAPLVQSKVPTACSHLPPPIRILVAWNGAPVLGGGRA